MHAQFDWDWSCFHTNNQRALDPILLERVFLPFLRRRRRLRFDSQINITLMVDYSRRASQYRPR